MNLFYVSLQRQTLGEMILFETIMVGRNPRFRTPLVYMPCIIPSILNYVFIVKIIDCIAVIRFCHETQLALRKGVHPDGLDIIIGAI